MSSAVVSTSAAQSRLFIFDDESAPGVGPDSSVDYVGTAVPGCPVEQSSTAVHAAPQLSGVTRHDSQGRLPLHEHLQSAITNQRFPPASIVPASHLAIRPAPEMVPSGIAALDILTGGLPRGCITEICGPVSSGRTSVLLAALSAATRRGECCALIDATDALDPHSATAAAVDLDHLLWVRCGDSSPRKNNSPRKHRSTEEKFSEVPRTNPPLSRSGIVSAAKDPLQNGGGNGLSRNFYHYSAGSALLNNIKERLPQRTSKVRIQSDARASEHRLEQVLRATDLLLESRGFGLIALDLADVPPESARRIPLTTWFRFRRAIERTPTILLVIEPQPIAGSCSSLLLQLGVPGAQYPVPSSRPSHSHLLTGLEITAELIRSRHDRKPANSVAFETRTAWAG